MTTRRYPTGSGVRIVPPYGFDCSYISLRSTYFVWSALSPLLRGGDYSHSRIYLVLAVIIPIYLFTAVNRGAYAAALIRDPLRAAARGIQSLVLAIGIVILVAFSLKTSANFSRLTVSIGAALSVTTITIARYFFTRHAIAILGGNPFRTVLIRDGKGPVPHGSYSTLFATEAGFDPERHDPGMYDNLAKALEGADRIIVSCEPDKRLSWAHSLKGVNIQSEILVPELDELAPLGIDRHDSISAIVVSKGPLKLVDRFVKRGFDMVIATLAVLFLSPVLACAAILIKLDSAGPIFFRQTRIGRGNELFEILKFRSMRTDQSDGKGDRSTGRHDDRITRVGSFIRRTSIDELPQLFNVLRGEMSIVGPRPHALGSRAQEKLFWEIDTRYWHRHATKPGLTGLAQIRGYRGATVYESDLTNRLQADLEYLNDWTIWRDFKIIVQTFRVVFHRNAY